MSSTPFGKRSCHRLGWSDGQRECSTLKAALLGDAHSFAAHRSGCPIVVHVPGCNVLDVELRWTLIGSGRPGRVLDIAREEAIAFRSQVKSSQVKSNQDSKWRSPFRRLWCPSLARAIGRADLGATGTTG